MKATVEDIWHHLSPAPGCQWQPGLSHGVASQPPTRPLGQDTELGRIPAGFPRSEEYEAGTIIITSHRFLIFITNLAGNSPATEG